MRNSLKNACRNVLAALVLALPLVAAGAGSAAAAPELPSVQVDARACSDTDPTPQIRLVLGPGAVVCYGGYRGSLRVDDLWATGLASGGYWGYVTCNLNPNYPQELFAPNEFVPLSCPVMWIGITGPNWTP